MSAGGMDRRITIERASIAKDGFGAEVKTWAGFATVWAKSTPVSDGEKWRAGEIGATISHRFKIRWSQKLASLNAKDRLRFDGKVFEIHGVKEIGRRQHFEISASTRAE